MGAVIVAASGPTLPLAVEHCRELPVIAVNDAWRLLPWAAALYAADFTWWRAHGGVPDFKGRKVTCVADVNGPADVAQLDAWHVEQVTLDHGDCSLHGAIALAIREGYTRIILVGADLRSVDGRLHFFGDHVGLRNTRDFTNAIASLERLRVPPYVEIVNATSGSALNCFPQIELTELCATGAVP